MIKQKKTKKKNVNVNQTVVVNIQKGKRNPRAKASAPQVMNAPQIIPPQVGSAYHQAVYGARAPAIPSMGNIAGYYGGMMSPFNAPLHVASEVQQAQLRSSNELAGANLQRPALRPTVAERVPEPERMPQPERRPISRLVKEMESQLRLQEKPLPSVSQLQALPPMPRLLPQLALQQAPVQAPLQISLQQAPLQAPPQQAPLQVVEEKRKPIRISFYPDNFSYSNPAPNLLRQEVVEPAPVPPPVPEKPKPIRTSFYPDNFSYSNQPSFDQFPFVPFASSISVPEDRPNLSVPAISFSKPSAPLSMEAPEPIAQRVEQEQEQPEQIIQSVKRKPEMGDNEPEPERRPRGRPEIGEPNYQGIVAWIDRQVVKQGNSPIGISKDTFIQQLSGQVGRQFTVGNIKNKSFDEIKRRAKKFINDIIQAGQ